ncbi:hypothetical protein BH23BAC2_BH23BAC2_20200 [soil metagenome]
MHILKFFIFFIAVAGIAQTSQLSEKDLAVFKKEVAARANNLESLSCDFTQVKFIQLMDEKAVSKGKLFYNAPNVLKWEYSSPYNYQILFKENQLHVNDDGNKSVTNIRSNNLMEKLVGLISGSVNGRLITDQENFDVTYSRSGKNIIAWIIPKDPLIKQMFNEIVMIFTPDHILSSVKLMEDGGDYTQIDFRNIKLNQILDKAIFEK